MAVRSVVGCLFLFLSVAYCSKILIIAAHSTRSHYTLIQPLIEGLASRQHQITTQAYYTLPTSLSNVKELKIKQGSLAHTAAMKQFFLNSLKNGPITQIRNFGKLRPKNCADYLNDDSSKKLVAAGKQFDLVIVDAFHADCPTAIASLVGKYIINMYTSASYPWQVTAAPMPLAYIPNCNTLMPHKMTFFQRLENAFNTATVRYIYKYSIQTKNYEVMSAILPQAGTIEDIEKKVVFSLTNADPVLDSPRPSVPNIVHCGGMHCAAAKPLPKDLNDFVETSGNDGFIIFSLGSNIKAEHVLEGSVLKHLISAFARLKQKVIWKFEAKLENLPRNVMVTEWMPQQDLLGHPKSRLFITHSGLLSVQEAVYHRVPVIGFPFFGDQRGNIIRMKELGIGEHFDFLNITADGFYEMINQVLNDKSYYENMKKYSAIFKDQMERPLDRAIYWIEYVIRHDGAQHLRTAGEDLDFIQYFLLDVLAFVTFVVLSTICVVFFLMRCTLKKLFTRKQSQTAEFVKKNQVNAPKIITRLN